MLNIYEQEEVICAEGTLGQGRKVFVYWVDGMLIDTGAEKMQESLIPFYKKYGFDQVVLTHNHEDHTGTAAWIEEHLQKPIFVHQNGVALCRLPGEYPKYRQQTWGGRIAFSPLPLPKIVQSRHHTWKVIYTPGHAGDHTAFYNEATGQLFSGDLFVSPKTKVMMATESVPEIRESLNKLLATDFRSLYCSHAGYLPNGRDMLQAKLENLENLTEATIDLAQKGLSALEIRDRLLPGAYPIIAFSEGEWDSLHVINSILQEGRPDRGAESRDNVAETARLVLKVFTPEDAHAARDFWGDEEVMKASGGATPHSALPQVLDGYRKCQLEKGLSVYAVVEKSTGEVIGAAGFNITESDGRAELIYHFSRNSWGKGYATEAVSACIGLARQHPNTHLVHASADPANQGSLRILEKTGFRSIGMKWFDDTLQHEPYYELPV
ncbi:GNAT family N-acetyltransferase [Planococcus sp. FY231025]|uniref:GNAT family N-acetyltransferase n=1 Tax=Planococcus sp. FY231025 TaxID=3455699 RepID=UPI003F92B6E7